MHCMKTSYILKKITHTAALDHIVRQVHKSRPDTVVPIVIHFDEHGKIMQTAFWLFSDEMEGIG
jgi:hypothetical protein